ncbi:acyl-CoA thioesterase [Desulfuromonas acetoxidans]|uniref:Thioesterase superfamily n=1 Tax=Desulfuromonas acetoxidans (strain DSM 684 / 11070) TaxID=281689 RepID=Q1K1H6_DESA6|nr:acyl-CoA thioesterase [Desulfuromonas acetoxidans]EAT16412.1 thioesterase superfamily [Desulfuromonas acetoxidans DSM 684]MBF0644357.1 acyl-CoA thioesterase [Desulfuromonas acetoxidans]NVD23551.1 acyl-CoA thioesterase [Desulfuromonas acetoxidans]NVE16064.1 acyl-CoA thioesterase [Desulfuromonas acetoxidans]
MAEKSAKPCSESRVTKTSVVLPPDANTHGTLFGGKMMAYVDEVASISAMRHARTTVVTAFIDSVEFLCPVRVGQAVTLESFVCWTGTTSLEVYVKVVAEDLMSGEKQLCLTSLLVFVALDSDGTPIRVPEIVAETDFEQALNAGGERRLRRRRKSKALMPEGEVDNFSSH